MTAAVEEHQTLRSVEVAQQAEADSWALADAIYEDVAELTGVDRSIPREPDIKTGAKQAEETIEREMRQAGLDASLSYIDQLYKTSHAWPPEDRVAQASFTAHYLLRSKTYEGKRKERLEKLAARSSTGQVRAIDVRRWISERKPRQQWTFLQLVEKRVRSATKSAVKQPWGSVTQDDRESIAKILHTIANEIEEGSFPPKATT